MRRRRAAPRLVAVSLLLLGAALVPATAAAAPALPRVTMVGDSVASAIAYEQRAQATLRRGADVSLQLAPCRRVGQTSCPHNGTTAPNVLQLIPTLGDKLAGSTVIVAVGYNDYEQEYARNIEDALAALRGAGVQRVLWVTLRAERQSYLAMNEMVRAASARHPELTVVDWNLYARSHADWFQPDGLHLTALGAQAMATLLHETLVRLGIVTEPVRKKALRVAAPSVVRAAAGRPYAARLVATGGKAPYRWTRASGAVPAGLRLSVAGRLTGTPAARGRFTFVVRVTDASRTSATRRVTVQIA